MYYFLKKVWIKFQKRMYIQRCYFFSQIFIGECIYKIFSITMYVQKDFFFKKKHKFFDICTKFRNFQMRVYLQKYSMCICFL